MRGSTREKGEERGQDESGQGRAGQVSSLLFIFFITASLSYFSLHLTCALPSYSCPALPFPLPPLSLSHAPLPSLQSHPLTSEA